MLGQPRPQELNRRRLFPLASPRPRAASQSLRVQSSCRIGTFDDTLRLTYAASAVFLLATGRPAVTLKVAPSLGAGLALSAEPTSAARASSTSLSGCTQTCGCPACHSF